MGATLSRNVFGSRVSEPCDTSPDQSCKRQKLTPNDCEENPRLIPNLPDEISIQILARIPRIYYLDLKLVSHAWKTAILSDELFNFRKELGTKEEWLYILTKLNDAKWLWYALDPTSRKWQRLPLMPGISLKNEAKKAYSGLRMWNMTNSSIRIADAIMAWLRRKDSLDQMPFFGCSVGAINSRLYVLGGFSGASAMNCVWQYDPILNSWSETSPMSVSRAYCKTGVLNGKLYAVGGVTRGDGGLTPLQSAEVFDPHTGIWSQIPNMPFTKAQVLPTPILAELLKPIATGLTSFRGKLFVPQSLYCWPFFVDIGGEVYDPGLNSWCEMPTGMGEDWPARKAGSKLSITVDGELYVLDPSSSLDNAKIKVYDYISDTWNVVAEDVPVPDFLDSDSPYLLAGLSRKLHVITKDGNNNIMVMQADVKSQLDLLRSGVSCLVAESAVESETDVIKVIASRTVGSHELVSCQTIDI